MKGDLVATVVTVAIVVTSSIIVVNMVSPVLKEGKIIQSYNSAKQIMNAVDTVINELIYEAPGSVRTIEIATDEGDFVVLGNEDKLKFALKDVSIIEPGARVKEGNIIITAGPSVRAYESDVNNDGLTELVLENDAVLFAVRKYGNSTDHVPINTANIIPLITNKRTGISVTPISSIKIEDRYDSSYGNGYSELTREGYELESSGIVIYMNSSSYDYEALFTLGAGNDFIELEIKHIEGGV